MGEEEGIAPSPGEHPVHQPTPARREAPRGILPPAALERAEFCASRETLSTPTNPIAGSPISGLDTARVLRGRGVNEIRGRTFSALFRLEGPSQLV